MAPAIWSWPVFGVLSVRFGANSATSCGERPTGSTSISAFLKFEPVTVFVTTGEESTVTCTLSCTEAMAISASRVVVRPSATAVCSVRDAIPFISTVTV